MTKILSSRITCQLPCCDAFMFYKLKKEYVKIFFFKTCVKYNYGYDVKRETSASADDFTFRDVSF